MTDTTDEKLKQRLKDLYDDPREYSLGQISEACGVALDRIKELEEKLFSATMDGYDMAKYEYRDRIEELRADLEATASPSIATPLDDPRVKALVDQLRIELASHEDEAGFYDELCNDEAKSYHTNRANKIRAALGAIASPSISALEENK